MMCRVSSGTNGFVRFKTPIPAPTFLQIGLHAITGCDSVSGFYGKGKAKAAKLLFKEMAYQQALGELGMEHEVSEDLCAKLDSFVCHLYGQSACTDVNEARFA